MSKIATINKPALSVPEKPKLTPEQEKIQAEKGRNQFVQEMHFQVYRIDNILKTTNRETVANVVSKDPSLVTDPLIMKFLSSYGAGSTNEFINQTKIKSEAEREKLLEGVRRVIYKAKAAHAENMKDTRIVSEKERKASEESKEESKKFDELMKKELNDAELNDIENNMARPFDIRKGNIDMNKVQHQYKSMIMGQKALGTHMQRFQEKFSDAIKKVKAHEKKYKGVNGTIIGYGYRKVKGLLGWAGSKLGISKPSKSIETKTNEHLTAARKYYGENLERVKNLQKNIEARSKEIKDGLGIYKTDIRGKLKELIGREDWAKAMQLEKEEAKKKLEEKKKELQASLKKAREQGDEIDDAKKSTTGLGAKLKLQTDKIQGGETSLNTRIDLVKSRIQKLEQIYGRDDPRVVEMRQKVLVPLLEGKDRMAKVKNGTAEKLSDVEQRNQKLDILKSNIYLNETNTVVEIEKLEAAVKMEDKKIEMLSKHRVELGSLIEGVEVAYGAIDDFKKNVTTNIDKMTKDNKSAVDTLDKQYAYLKNAKVKEPGMGTAWWNTPGIGKYGALGVLDYGVNKGGAIIMSYLVKGKWDSKYIDKWSLTGMLGRVSGALDGWLNKGGFKAESWYGKIFAEAGNFSAGVLSTAVGLVNGVTMLVLQPHRVIDSLGEIVTDWKKLKETLKHVIHYNDWAEGRFSAAAGRTAGDLVVLFFTAGSSAGAQAAAKVGQVGGTAAAKAAAYAAAFSKEILRQSVNGAVKVGRFALYPLRHPILSVRALTTTPLRNAYNWTNATVKGERQIYNLQRAEGKLATAKTTLRDGLISSHTETIIAGTGSAEIKSLLTRLRNEINAEKAASQAVTAEGKAAVQAGATEGKFMPPVAESASKTLSKLSVEELKLLSKELSRELYRTSSWSTRNAIDKLGKQVQSYMKVRVEVLARSEVLFNQKFAEGSNINVVRAGKEEPGWIVGKERGNGNVEIYRTKDGVKMEAVVSKEEVLAWNRGAVEGTAVKDVTAAFDIRFKQGESIAVRKADGALEAGWKIETASENGIVTLSRGNQKLTATKDSLLRSNISQPHTWREIRLRRSKIREEIGKYYGIEEEFAKTRLAELTAEYKALDKGLVQSAKGTAAADVKVFMAENPALAYQRGFIAPDLARKVLLFVSAPVWVPFSGIASFFKLTGNKIRFASPEYIARMRDMRFLGNISEEINLLVKGGRLKEAVNLYNSAKLAAKQAGVPFTYMDKSFLGYLHRVMPISAVIAPTVVRLNDPKTIERMPYIADVKLDEISKMEKEHSEAMKKIIIAQAWSK